MLEKRHKLESFVLSIISGLLLALPFLFAGLWWTAWLALVPLLVVIDKTTSYKETLRFCFFAGIVYFAASLYWLYYTSLVGLLIAVIYCSLYVVLFGLVLKLCLIKKRLSALNLFFITPSIWVICEFLRSCLFTGFGWNQLGYSQFENLRLIQIADFSGVYGVSFLIVMVNAFLKEITVSFKEIISYNKRIVISKAALGLIVILMIFTVYAYGDIKLNKRAPQETIRVSVIQGNIPQRQKWESFYRDMILQKYIRLSGMASLDRPDIIVWPETSLPGYLEDYNLYKQVSDFVKDVNIPLLIGAPRLDSYNENYYNSAILFSNEGKVLNLYDKIHLVPFGEYVPFKSLFAFLTDYYEIADFSKGDVYTIFSVEDVNFGVLICFEDVFASLVRTFVLRGADFMINITNDAWFYDSAEPRQHLSASVFRAVENRISFVRSANTGISGFIDPCGRLIGLVSKENKHICVEGVLTADVPIYGQKSLYLRFGNVFVIICFVFLVSCYFKPSRF
jgi:apolipoprotein N-acyltransferase